MLDLLISFGYLYCLTMVQIIYSMFALKPNPDMLEWIATKTPRHKVKPLINILLRVLVS
jgi:hypothetical protein